MNRQGVLHTQSWAGRSETPVMVVGETPKKYRIRAITDTRLGGRGRVCVAGETALVPKHSVTLEG